MEKEKAIQIGENLRTVLAQSKFEKMLPELFYQNKPFVFDFSVNNPNMSGLDMSTPKPFMARKWLARTVLWLASWLARTVLAKFIGVSHHL